MDQSIARADSPAAILGHYTTAEVLATEAELMREAEQASSLSDWGEDQSFQNGLKLYVADLLALPPSRAAGLRATLVSLLVQRLTLIDDERQNPEILQEDVGDPVVILGLPRSGTTYTHALLALDPAARAPLVWEAAFPSPPPDAATFDRDPRIATLGAAMQDMLRVAPELRQKHDMKPLNEAECEQFMEAHFTSLDLWASFDVPRHARWITAGASQGVYAAHRRMLQQFQWRGPRGRWTLKSPDHIFRIDALVEAYPGACIVQTHRDPAKTIPSMASLIWTMRRLNDPDVDPLKIGKEAVEVWARGAEAAFARPRSAKVAARIFDISYNEIVGDPIGAVRRIHRHFDLPFTPAHEERIGQRIELDRSERTKPHSYGAQDFGIDPAALEFPEYREAFGRLF